MTDPIRGTYFQIRNLIDALHLGEPGRIVPALAFEAMAYGGPNKARSEGLLELSRTLAQRADTPYAHAMVALGGGGLSYFWGRWRDAVSQLERAEELLRDRCVGVTFELDSMRHMLYRALSLRGAIRELTERVPPVARDAESRQDNFLLTILRSVPLTLMALAEDNPEQAAKLLDVAEAGLPAHVFHVQHYLCMLARAQVHLYRGELREGAALLETRWQSFERSLLTLIALVRIQAREMRARLALATARREPARAAELCVTVEREIQALGREHDPWVQPLLSVLRGGVLSVRGDTERALWSLREALDGFVAHGMDLHAASLRLQLGMLVGGEEGRALLEEAHAWMAGQNIRAPLRMANLWVPGIQTA
jgi:hypothetical protein